MERPGQRPCGKQIRPPLCAACWERCAGVCFVGALGSSSWKATCPLAECMVRWAATWEMEGLTCSPAVCCKFTAHSQLSTLISSWRRCHANRLHHLHTNRLHLLLHHQSHHSASCFIRALQLEVAVDAENRLHNRFFVRPPLVRGAWLPTGALMALCALCVLCALCALCALRAVCALCACACVPSASAVGRLVPSGRLQACKLLSVPTLLPPNPTAAHEVADALTLAELPELPSAAAAGAAGEGSPGGAAAGGAEGAAADQQASGEPRADVEQQEGQEEQQGEEEEPEEEPLAWLPATLAAVALRLRSLDAALLYGDPPQPAARESLPGYQFIQRPTARGVVCGQPLGELQLWRGLGWRTLLPAAVGPPCAPLLPTFRRFRPCRPSPPSHLPAPPALPPLQTGRGL